jgi:ASF1 like histone chaperone
VPIGVNSFEFEGSPPDPSKIPEEDVLGVAALILTGSYKDQEFVRVGYYQNTEYDNEEMKEAQPQPKPIIFERLVRDISTKPRVTRFQIKWCVFFHALRSCENCFFVEMIILVFLPPMYASYLPDTHQGRRTTPTDSNGRCSFSCSPLR